VAYAAPYKRPTKWYERKALRQVLIGPAMKPIVYDSVTNSPAAAAGLRRGDEIVAMNGQKIYSPEAVAHAEETMTNGPIKPLVLTVKRGTEEIEKTLIPEKPLAETVRERTELIAERQLKAVEQTMRLEDQSVKDATAAKDLRRQFVEELLRRPARLWDEK